jgi:NADH-quinone oxidoreductase subunit J
VGDLSEWLRNDGAVLVPLVLGAAAVWLMMPRLPYRPALRTAGAACGLAALVTAGLWLVEPAGDVTGKLLFYVFAGAAVASGALMITDRNPVYSALWFALATLCVCVLFMLRSAPFLAAATTIVYAGAIIVTFLFVIMLARQHGTAIYDARSAKSLPAVVTAFALLGGMLYAIDAWRDARPVTQDAGRAASPRDGAPVAAQFLTSPVATRANPLSRPERGEVGTMRGLGRSLFGDYLFATELAGTLLLVAAVGAVALAPRRSQGTL